jgi:hypothetical protein
MSETISPAFTFVKSGIYYVSVASAPRSDL